MPPDIIKPSAIFETPEASGFSRVTHHSEVEGLVEEFEQRFIRVLNYGGGELAALIVEKGSNEITDWLRTALTTHSAKVREEERERILIGVKELLATFRLAKVQTAIEEKKPFEIAYNTLSEMMPEIITLVTPQTDVTKN